MIEHVGFEVELHALIHHQLAALIVKTSKYLPAGLLFFRLFDGNRVETLNLRVQFPNLNTVMTGCHKVLAVVSHLDALDFKFMA